MNASRTFDIKAGRCRRASRDVCRRAIRADAGFVEELFERLQIRADV